MDGERNMLGKAQRIYQLVNITMELALLLGGVIVSLIIEAVKGHFGGSTTATMIAVVVMSLVGGIAYTLLTHFGLWESFIGVLVSAGAFYAFIIKNIKE